MLIPSLSLSKSSLRYAKSIILALLFIELFLVVKRQTIHIENGITSTPVWGTNVKIPEGALNRLAKEPSGLRFERKIRKLFSSVEKNKERYWLANTDLTETKISVKVKPFLSNYDYKDSWKNRKEIFYDPRFTLSIYLNEIKEKALEAQGKQEFWYTGTDRVDLSEIDTIVLPFNWADWMDLRVLNEDIKKPIDQKINCLYIRKYTNNDPDTSYFCYNVEDIEDAQIERWGYHRDQLPGFIIHAHASHDDRTYNDFRVLQAKSYALTYLPKPYKVIILSGDENKGTIEFEVDPDDNLRITKSDLVLNYLKSHGISHEDMDDDFTLEFDHLKGLDDFYSKIIPKQLREEDDVSGAYGAFQKQSDSEGYTELKLTKDMFNYPSLFVDLQIEHFEKASGPIESLSRQERLYYEGLKECRKYSDSNEPTYFKMAVINHLDEKNIDHEYGWHYDWRFFNGALNYQRNGWTQAELDIRTNIILDRMLRSWSRFAQEKGIIYWIMHGPLLSWYWDGLMFPFDVDIDIQMPIVDLLRLAKEYNQTLVVEDPSEGYGKFMLDVGSYIHNRGISKNQNHIDARFIDVDSGIYIDITGLSKSIANAPEEYTNNPLVDITKGFKDDTAEIYNDRRKHFYTLPQLSPLKYSLLGGVPVYVPLVLANRLLFEYPKGLLSYAFSRWVFVHRLNLWLKKDDVVSIFNRDDVFEGAKIDDNKLLGRLEKMSDDEVFRLLQNDNILQEYYLTKKYTDLHAVERSYLFDELGRDSSKVNENPKLHEKYNRLVSKMRIGKPLRKALFDFENIERLKRKNNR